MSRERCLELTNDEKIKFYFFQHGSDKKLHSVIKEGEKFKQDLQIQTQINEGGISYVEGKNIKQKLINRSLTNPRANRKKNP